MQFDISETHRKMQSQLGSHLDSEEPDEPHSIAEEHHMKLIANQSLGETRENTFGTSSYNDVPLADPEEERRMEELQLEENKKLEKDLPGSMYNSNHEVEEIVRLKSTANNNPWDCQGRREMDSVVP